MNIDFMQIVAELGGGLSSMVIVGLFFLFLRKSNRVDQLTDTIISMGQSQTEAMHDLSRQIEKADQK